MNRNRLPSWINGAIDRVADSPMSPVGRLAAKRLGRASPTGSVPSTRFESRPIRLLIAPVNYSGQGTAWSRSLEAADPRISARSMAVEVPGGFSFDADLIVPVGTYHNDPDWQARQFEAASRATHVLVEAEEPPFGRLMGRSVGRQVDALLTRGVDVAYLAHGTDVRLPSRHAELSEWSYYRDPSVYLPRAEKLAARNIAQVTESGRCAFVSTPDLLLDLPDARWCPVAVDPERWRTARSRRHADTPLRVIHAPSNPILKGTPLILPTLTKLQSEGIITYTLIQGIPSAEMPRVLADADVLLDQFRLGSYGVAACEAMAAGCVVVGQISQQVRERVLEQSGHSLPIVEATPHSLENVLRKLAADPELSARRAAGIDFVMTLHDGRAAAHAMIDHWLSPPRTGK